MTSFFLKVTCPPLPLAYLSYSLSFARLGVGRKLQARAHPGRAPCHGPTPIPLFDHSIINKTKAFCIKCSLNCVRLTMVRFTCCLALLLARVFIIIEQAGWINQITKPRSKFLFHVEVIFAINTGIFLIKSAKNYTFSS